jgi:hypothetical protein
MTIRRLFRAKSGAFKARSPERDMSADAEAVQSILAPINLALERSEAERTGLKRRLDEVTSQAAIVAGNDLDDYLTRTADRSQMLDISEVEMQRAEERLKILDQNISHFKFLKTAVYTRFPDTKR